MTSLHKKWLMMLVAIILLPFFLVDLTIAINVVNPMALAFLDTFVIENKTNEEIFVTPIGAVGMNGERQPLSYSASSRFYIIIPSTVDYPIAPGGAREFTYDSDDIQFSEILVRGNTEDYHFISTDLTPTQEQYRSPEITRYEITDFNSKPLANEQHLKALPVGWPRIWTLYILASLGLFSPVFFIRALLTNTQENKTEDQ